MASKEVSPIRVWVFALAILSILATLGGVLMAVRDDPFPVLTDRTSGGTACQPVTIGRLVSHPWA